MAIEISDQKLIDIVYVDDDGTRHKYSGPFINDFTINPEIQEQINKLKELDININVLKDKLDTLKSSISSNNSKIKYVTELPEEPEENTCYVLPPDNSVTLKIYKDDVSNPNNCLGWVDFRNIAAMAKTGDIDSNPTTSKQYMYLNIPKDIENIYLVPDGNNWNLDAIKPYVTSELTEINYILVGNTFLYDKGTMNPGPFLIEHFADIEIRPDLAPIITFTTAVGVAPEARCLLAK